MDKTIYLVMYAYYSDWRIYGYFTTRLKQKTAGQSAVFLLQYLIWRDKMRKREKNGDKRRK